MENYIEKRLSELKKQYTDLLTSIGSDKNLGDTDPNKAKWVEVNDKKSRIDELNLLKINLK